MTSDPFVHLHVASGYSLRYGASHPHVLVQRAVDHGMDTLALTDRDGLYGAVRFAKACMSAGIRTVFGVDLAIQPSGLLGRGQGPRQDKSRQGKSRQGPARGGAEVDPRLPRVTVLAQGCRGWAALCRLVSATHLAGERGTPITTLGLIAEHAGNSDLVVLLGPASEVGRAVAQRRPDLARALLDRWRAVLPSTDLVIEVISHRAPPGRPGSPTALADLATTGHAARLLTLAKETGLTAVLTNAVRFADRSDAPVADLLDSARRLVPLDSRHVDRVNAENYLKSGKEMAEIAEEITRAAGLDGHAATRLLAATRTLAERCVLDPRADLGLGQVHFPELEVLGAGGSGVAGATGAGAGDTGATGAGAGDACATGLGEAVLRARCEAGIGRRYGSAPPQAVFERLEEELETIRVLGYASYFLTVADVCDLIREMNVRVAARGSGAGSLVCYLLGISGVDPIEHNLLMERFLSTRRQALPDIDIDVESARRTEVYERILERFGTQRVACVSMMDTYRVRHAIRDVGAALGMPLGEIDTLAKAFPHIRARDARLALTELPELRASGLGEERLSTLFALVERLDGLPRHVALHPCGVLLSDATLLDRTPVESSFLGFPMSQFDKDDVEDLGLLKLDVLGVRMQSAMAHAVAEIERVDSTTVNLDDREQVPFDDPATFELIQSTRTLGCFQIESPGQRELIGKFGPETFNDIIIDISLFRPGPVKSDMVTPFLEARQGWRPPDYLHPDLEPVLRETRGVVVFHEQVIEIISILTGCDRAEADEVRRALGDPVGKEEVQTWFPARAMANGYDTATVKRAWEVLEAFASFGFCKAHAAAFALPTYQSAWLKAHYPAAFFAGVLTHDPGMYPKRLILDDARNFGIAILGLDVNASDDVYRVERVDPNDEPPPEILGQPPRQAPPEGLPDARSYGIRLSLADVKGISDAEVARIIAGRPYYSLTDFWHRARPSRPIAERLVVAGGFDSIYGIGSLSARLAVRRRNKITRRDLLLEVAELSRLDRTTGSGRHRSRGLTRRSTKPASQPGGLAPSGDRVVGDSVGGNLTGDNLIGGNPVGGNPAGGNPTGDGRAPARTAPKSSKSEPPPAQLTLDFGIATAECSSGLPEMTPAEQVRAELDVLGLDVSSHVVDFYVPLLDALGVTRSRDLLKARARSEILVAGVKVATQTPPVRSGRRVIFLTLDDATGPVDATFFEDVQDPYAATVFHSWLLLVRGVVRRTGHRGVSLRATGCWELTGLYAAWESGGLPAVYAQMEQPVDYTERAVTEAAESRSTRPVITRPPADPADPTEGRPTAGGMGRRRVLVHPSGFRQSPYADLKPPGEDVKQVSRKLWHSSPGSSGR